MIVTSRPAVFLFIDCDPPVRIWTGSHPRRLPPDAVDTDGGVYIGLGLDKIPPLDRMLNGDAGQYTFTLDGLSPDLQALVDTPAGFDNARVSLGEYQFDADWQPTGAVSWAATFDAEQFGFTSSQGEDDGRSLSVVLTVSTATTDRRRAKLIHWSAQNAGATDRAFDYVTGLSFGTRRQYPA